MSQTNSSPQCFWCDVPLQFARQHGFWNIWLAVNSVGDPEYGIVTLWNDEQAYKRSISKPGGGSRSVGRKREKKAIKKTITERYRLE